MDESSSDVRQNHEMKLLEIFSKQLPKRTNWPRETGLTMVIDRKLGSRALEDVIELNNQAIDFWKFGYGTSVVMAESVLQEKIKTLVSKGIKVFPGGTLFEFAFFADSEEAYLEECKKHGFNAIEISSGTLNIPRERREAAIKKALSLGFTVLSEVGNKDPRSQPTCHQIVEEIARDFSAGSHYVILEGRESGRAVGVFDENGEIKEDFLDRIYRNIDDKVLNRIIWEAPNTNQQIYFIKKFGCNINLGNINPDDVLGLETLRLGLRWDTFSVELRNRK